MYVESVANFPFWRQAHAGGWMEVGPAGGKKRDGMKRGDRGVKRGYQLLDVMKEVGG